MGLPRGGKDGFHGQGGESAPSASQARRNISVTENEIITGNMFAYIKSIA